MGRSEWGIPIMTIADFDKLMLVLADQKENEGEPLEVNSAIAFKGVAYVCLGNGGGRDDSTAFLKKKLPDFKIMEPFDKPDGWTQCQDYISSKNKLFLRQELVQYLETKQIPKHDDEPADDDEEEPDDECVKCESLQDEIDFLKGIIKALTKEHAPKLPLPQK